MTKAGTTMPEPTALPVLSSPVLRILQKRFVVEEYAERNHQPAEIFANFIKLVRTVDASVEK